MMASKIRIEADSLGKVSVPADAYFGAQTQRALENFPISGYRLGRRFIRALGLIKRTAAQINLDLGRLDKGRAEFVLQAAQEVIDGKFDDQFVLDVFQTGSGTSTNMNANEVIANRAIELAGGIIGSREPIHPNDHVNLGQSSNDVIPTAIHISASESIQNDLVPALKRLTAELEGKARAFNEVVKIGRTHLQDATPVRLGQEFAGYARQAELSKMRGAKAVKALRELPIGGTAVGTGVNTHPEFGRRMCKALSAETGIEFIEAEDHFEAQAAKDAICEVGGQLNTIASSLTKIASDIRLLSSGPRCGLGEIQIPAVQPGSSIMPGKTNPVICEMLLQVCAHVTGNVSAITVGCREGQLELNTMMPMLAYNLLESIRLLAAGSGIFAEKCVSGIEAEADRCSASVEQSLAMCTALAPLIGYDQAAEIAQEALDTGKTIREITKQRKVLSEEEIDNALDPRRMTEGG